MILFENLVLTMEKTFKEVVSKIKEGGSMTIDGAIQWLKEAKVIDGKQVTEEKARSAFDGGANGKLEFAKFEEGLKNIAEYAKMTMDDLHRKLEAAKPQIASMAEAGISAISKALEAKK